MLFSSRKEPLFFEAMRRLPNHFIEKSSALAKWRRCVLKNKMKAGLQERRCRGVSVYKKRARKAIKTREYDLLRIKQEQGVRLYTHKSGPEEPPRPGSASLYR